MIKSCKRKANRIMELDTYRSFLMTTWDMFIGMTSDLNTSKEYELHSKINTKTKKFETRLLTFEDFFPVREDKKKDKK